MEQTSWKFSLQSKFGGLFILLLGSACVLLISSCIYFYSSSYNQQASSYLADVTALAAQNENYVIGQVDQLSVSVLMDSTVQQNLNSINQYEGASENTQEISRLGTGISNAVSASVFSLDCVVSLRIYSLYGDEIFIGTTNREALEISLTEEEIYAASGGALWSMPTNSDYLCVCRGILSTSTFQPLGYMVLVCETSAFCEAISTPSRSYASHVYVLDEQQKAMASNAEEAIGATFPYQLDSLYTNDNRTINDLVDGDTCYYYIAPEMDNGWVMITVVSVQQFRDSIGKSIVIMVLLLFVAIALSGWLSMAIIRRIMQPTRELVSGMRQFGEGKLDTRIEVRTRDEIGSVGRAYNQMADSIQNLMEKVYKLELAQKEAEIEFLKAQINPHFLYNTLDTISWLGTLNGIDDITDISVSLASLLRANVKSESMITVDAEMNTVRDYLQIQHYRFGDKFSVQYDIAPETEEHYMPNFLLQPLVENSIIHGLENQNGSGQLSISIQKEGEWLRISVSDTGIGMSEEQVQALLRQCEDMETHHSIGLKNVYRRLHLLYGEACQFSIQSAPNRGTCISFRIPTTQTKTQKEKNV